MEIIQYEIYWVNLDPTIGKEMKKTRPCLILSPDEMNTYLGTVIVAPLTTTIKNYPSRIKFVLNSKQCTIALDQIKTIDKARLQNKIAQISASVIFRVKEVLEEMLIK